LETEKEIRSYVFDPYDPIVLRWKFFSLAFDTISFFRLPWMMAWGQIHMLWDIIPDIYFFLDHVLALNTGFYYRDILVVDRTAIFRRYMSWDHFLTLDRGSIYVFVSEFIPFYACVVVRRYIDLPFWVLSICAIPRGRRTYDLLDFFYRLEVNRSFLDIATRFRLIVCPPLTLICYITARFEQRRTADSGSQIHSGNDWKWPLVGDIMIMKSVSE